ncbi:hypothetical protein BZG36_01680 [Bifiguratus adelaidae]|uniref:Phosphotransferase n=1 Tax=Bifiguratus adelaidae TaxID=1938954 RepID=A0A261Y4S6_9FUNG|nr:hypothetical protein BZG36_01680 [Bifiguratus adelaidae]
MTSIESDKDPNLKTTKEIIEQTLNLPETKKIDRQIVKKICELVGTRAARLYAATIGAMLFHCNMVGSQCSVDVDGSLYEFYSNFETRIYDALKELYGPDIAQHAKLGLAKDGSGVGAALMACVASKMKRRPSSNFNVMSLQKAMPDNQSIRDMRNRRDFIELLVYYPCSYGDDPS